MSCIGCSGDPNKNVIPVFYNGSVGYSGSEGQKNVIVSAGFGISVEDQSDSEAFRFEVSTLNYTPLTISLSLLAKESSVSKSNPVLKGTVIDEVDLSWEYNKTILSQLMSNSASVVNPTLAKIDREKVLSGLTINANASFTIQGNDGAGRTESIVSDTKAIQFGNYLFLGVGSSKLNSAVSSIESFIEAMPKTIKTSRAHTYYATGGSNEKHFVAYPKSFGLGVFTKLSFQGGYVRLKNVAGTLVFDAGENPETDIIITNEKGYAEAYYIYESLVDNQADAVNAFTIS